MAFWYIMHQSIPGTIIPPSPPPPAGTQTTSSSSTLRHFSLITQRVVHINVWFFILVNSCLCKNAILIETLHAMTPLHDCYFIIACEQAHRALWRRVGKGRSTCNYVSLIWISASKKSMQNADLRSDDVSNDIITLGMCFSLFVYLHLCSFLLRADWWKSDNSVDGETRELEVEFKFKRCSCKLSFLFPPHHQSALESLLSG